MDSEPADQSRPSIPVPAKHPIPTHNLSPDHLSGLGRSTAAAQRLTGPDRSETKPGTQPYSRPSAWLAQKPSHGTALASPGGSKTKPGHPYLCPLRHTLPDKDLTAR
ncbi:hypothetical protein L1987_60601 [Smallanthus sonchifolius]|uniref:Uncharacterized protein n=1 Tax=Smallanthus sonchifolius TaxID=185202 RepID=A0ACB9D8W7_9ASTR|nr:hypothetical protein L1987_60601 [Smallanthus sonchifolius]